jgi:hypothetical protein
MPGYCYGPVLQFSSSTLFSTILSRKSWELSLFDRHIYRVTASPLLSPLIYNSFIVLHFLFSSPFQIFEGEITKHHRILRHLPMPAQRIQDVIPSNQFYTPSTRVGFAQAERVALFCCGGIRYVTVQHRTNKTTNRDNKLSILIQYSMYGLAVALRKEKRKRRQFARHCKTLV